MSADANAYRIPVAELRDFVAAVFRATGSADGEAQIVADHLVDANLAGHESHGVIRVSKYVDWHAKGMVLANQHALVVRETPCNAVVDGQFGYGQVIGREAMDLAIAKARQSGFCAMAIRNAGHLGRIGAWAEQVAQAGLRLHPFRQHFRLRHPRRAARRHGPPALGESDCRQRAGPRRCAAGARHLDLGDRRRQDPGRAEPRRATAAGMHDRQRGAPQSGPAVFYGPPVGALLPMGGHKGYGLSIFCEIFAGALSGGQTTNPDNATAGRLVNNMLSLVFDAEAFCGAEAFRAEIARMAAWVKASPPAVRRAAKSCCLAKSSAEPARGWSATAFRSTP